MKVLLVNHLYWPNVLGGAEQFTKGLAEALVSAGHEAAVVTLSGTDRTHADRVNGVTVHYLAVNNALSHARRPSRTFPMQALWHVASAVNPRMGPALERVFAAERPDIVHTNSLPGLTPRVWTVARARGVPVVHTLHDYFLMCARGTMFRNGRNCAGQCASCRAFTWRRRALSGLPDAVVGISRFVLDRHLEAGYCTSSPIRSVIHNGCDVEPAPVPDTPADRVRFGYLGRLHAIKGIDALIEAFRGLPPNLARLTIAGKGSPDYTQRLQKAAGDADIVFAGFVDRETFYANVDIVVVPSAYEEPFGLVVLEALARGRPVIASRRGGIPEIVEEGDTGWLFDPDEPEALARAMRTAIDSRERLPDLRQAAVERARAFAPGRNVADYLGLYARVVAASADRASTAGVPA